MGTEAEGKLHRTLLLGLMRRGKYLKWNSLYMWQKELGLKFYSIIVIQLYHKLHRFLWAGLGIIVPYNIFPSENVFQMINHSLTNELLEYNPFIK